MPPKGWKKPPKPPAVSTVIYLTGCSDCGTPAHPTKLRRAGPSWLCRNCDRQDRQAVKQEARQQAIEDEARHQRQQAALGFLTALAERRNRRGKGVMTVPEEFAVKTAKLPDRVAALIGKSYAEKGDDAELADDEIVGMIRDLLLEIDPTLIERNKNKRLSRRA